MSFSYYVLEELKNKLGSDYRYYLIGTTNKILPIILNFIMEGLPRLNKFIKEKLNNTDWLTGVWFDPKWVNKYTKIFNRINENRIKRQKHRLELFLSAYGLSYDDFIKSLTENGVLSDVTGIIFEILSEPDRQ